MSIGFSPIFNNQFNNDFMELKEIQAVLEKWQSEQEDRAVVLMCIEKKQIDENKEDYVNTGAIIGKGKAIIDCLEHYISDESEDNILGSLIRRAMIKAQIHTMFGLVKKMCKSLYDEDVEKQENDKEKQGKEADHE